MEPVQVFKLLSDESRLRIIALLYKKELCVCELVGALDLPQPKVSKALSKLRDLNLVEDHRQDKFIFYRLNDNSELLKYILDYLFLNIDHYPLLKEDLLKSQDTKSILDNCSVK